MQHGTRVPRSVSTRTQALRTKCQYTRRVWPIQSSETTRFFMIAGKHYRVTMEASSNNARNSRRLQFPVTALRSASTESYAPPLRGATSFKGSVTVPGPATISCSNSRCRKLLCAVGFTAIVNCAASNVLFWRHVAALWVARSAPRVLTDNNMIHHSNKKHRNCNKRNTRN
jgi:hypothetical protein